MTDPYLIAHKVRGEPAFDVAIRMACPECNEYPMPESYDGRGCHECDSLGYWWVIPTSGHRAYPYWHCEIADLAVAQGNMEYYSVSSEVPDEMPPSLPDHYVHREAPKVSLTEALGIRPAPQPKIVRRM